MVRARSAASSLAPKPSGIDLRSAGHKRPLYLCAGHVTRDLEGSGWSFGGPVYFSSRTATALGCDVVAITRLAGSDLPLLKQKTPGIEWLSKPAGVTTTFENIYGSAGRTQRVHAQAPRLAVRDAGAVPLHPRIVHIAPVLREIGAAFLGKLAANRFVGLTAQGLLRSVNCDGVVSVAVARSAPVAFQIADVSIVSVEDFDGDVAQARDLLARSRVGVLTDGHRVIHAQEEGRWFELPVVPQPIRNPTGTGDVFATALFVRYEATGNLERSLEFAATIAADWISAKDAGLFVTSSHVKGQ